ncbi:restriction endonuclease subunit S [Serratia marcescens]|uniref:restriction endonuclease subunit S n=1 Tax=Serratia marcescens TaxID=615 RepID=UPI00186775BE|nr:restriction endonuclease subunit S [Serratia marcescens]MBN5271192.1 restriction endonuclease subunit S [Serratia marcescens]MBN5275321.1 restriction endonuclease subunit S [Serratia marcescens]MBN5307078.1 restriction endonuclease subunit S [Serratia marcescens]MBN5361892.1 restriction endonuclease subunit S [Serratia marcescens]MBN5422806.1 restriction endonuclease subunit S [Serratia marcescens]
MSVEKLITDHIDIWSSALQTRSTAGRGSNGKIDLYGIKKLRELILELAVRGKLVPQDPNDEPASELLKRIAAEKAELVKQGKIKKQKPLPEISEDEKPFELPEGWEWVRFGNVYEMEYGDNLPQDKRTNTGEYNVYGSNGVVGTHNEPCVNSPCIVIGRKGSAGALNLSLNAGCWVTDVAYSTIPPVAMNLDFVYLQFHTLGLDLLGKGIKPGLNRRDAYALTIAIPPQNEQKNIVSKVKELMSLCDQLEQQYLTSLEAHLQLVETLLATLTDSQNAEELAENWARISQHFDTLFTTEASIDALKQTILQLAVMGKLVPQDPNDEPASELLKRIEQEKAQLVKEGKIKKQKPLPSVSDEEKPFELPIGWVWCRLPDLGELARGKSKHRPRNDPALYSNGNCPLVQTGDVSRSNGVIKTYTALYNELGVKQSRIWPRGTLCITIAANIADSGILEFDACFPDSVVGYSPFFPEMPVKYFDIYMRTMKASLEKYAPSTAQKNINLDILSQVLVPCPPLNEFERIVEKVDVLFSIFDTLKSRLQSAQQTQLHLADALTDAALN